MLQEALDRQVIVAKEALQESGRYSQGLGLTVTKVERHLQGRLEPHIIKQVHVCIYVYVYMCKNSISICTYMYICRECMSACNYVRTYVCMYVCMYLCMYVGRYVCMYVCMPACMIVCMHVSVQMCTHRYIMHAYMYIHIYECV